MGSSLGHLGGRLQVGTGPELRGGQARAGGQERGWRHDHRGCRPGLVCPGPEGCSEPSPSQHADPPQTCPPLFGPTQGQHCLPGYGGWHTTSHAQYRAPRVPGDLGAFSRVQGALPAFWLEGIFLCTPEDILRQPPNSQWAPLSCPHLRASRPGLHPCPPPPWLRLTLSHECPSLAKP